MNGLISLISLSALILAVSGQLSSLSPSFSYQGFIAATANGQASYTGTISQSVDMSRGLSIGDTTIGLALNIITLYSVTDNTVYISTSGVCVERALTANDIPYDMNIWDLYAAGVELPAGTFTFTHGLIIYQVTILNGEPAVFTTTTGNVIEVTTVTNFDNTTPAFSTFSLPSGCSRFNCTACYPTSPFPVLSPSYSLQGALVRTENGVQTLVPIYSVSVDLSRQLQFVDETVTTTGAVSNNIRLSSATDSATYLSVNGVCSVTALNPNIIFPLNTNVWDLFAAGTEFPTGTYTYTQDITVYQVTIVNGEPAMFTITSGNAINVITVTNFDNTTPAFSTFSLPSECSQFTCTACYQTPPFPNLSPSYSLQGGGVRRENGVQVSTPTYSVSVDVSQRLQFVGETVRTTTGAFSNNIRLSSATDSATYISVSGVCNVTAFNPNILFPLNTNVWDLFAAGTESTTGTFTYTQDGTVNQVTIVNGQPLFISSATGTSEISILVTHFDNRTPDFSTFSLPSECSQFNCTACYNSAVSVSISVLLLLTTLLLYLFATH